MSNEQSFWFFIVNPTAGNGKGRRLWPRYERFLQSQGLCFDWAYTESPGHATTLARQAYRAGYLGLVAVGGDGTGNEVANGLLAESRNIPHQTLPLFTMLPIGTGNDWVRQYGIPRRIGPWYRFFSTGQTSVQDVGLVEWKEGSSPKQRYFINVMGMGYDGYVAVKAAEQGGKMASKLSYLMLVFRCLFSYHTPRLKVAWGAQEIVDDIYAIVIGVNRFSGGGFRLVPQAVPDDGLLAITIAKKLARWQVMVLSPLFFTGFIGWHPAIRLDSCECVDVTPLDEEPVLLEADGEPLGCLPARVSILPRALPLWVPS